MRQNPHEKVARMCIRMRRCLVAIFASAKRLFQHGQYNPRSGAGGEKRLRVVGLGVTTLAS
jgi:hypothetical protein